MKMAIVVLGNVLKLSPIVNINFEFEKMFDFKNTNSGFDLPNIHITHGTNTSMIHFQEKTINLTKPLGEYIKQQLRTQSEGDVLGIYGATDEISFEEPDCEKLDIYIYYNVRKKVINIDDDCEFLAIIDNEATEVSNNGVINFFLGKQVPYVCIATTNPNYEPPIQCDVEFIEC